MQVSIVNNLAEVDSLQWNQLITDNNPFCKHEFLNALELHNCVGKQFGWIPRHIIVTENNQLIGAAILYEKYDPVNQIV